MSWIRQALSKGLPEILILEKIPKTLQVWRDSGLGGLSFREEDSGLVVRLELVNGYADLTFCTQFVDNCPVTDAGLAVALKRIIDAISNKDDSNGV